MNKKIIHGSRNAPNGISRNGGKDFHDKYGMLKEGYNTTGGEGMVAVGMTTVGGTVGAGKDGMRGYTEDRVVFGPAPTPAAQQPAPSTQEPEEPPKTLDDYTDRAKDEDHLAAEDAYKDNYKNGNPWEATSAVDSYQTAFDRAVAAGSKMTANDYLMQRSDDKKGTNGGGVNRFIGYLGDKNTLANEEQDYAFKNFMDKAEHLDFKGPPTLDDPSEAYDKYKNDIDSIGD